MNDMNEIRFCLLESSINESSCEIGGHEQIDVFKELANSNKNDLEAILISILAEFAKNQINAGKSFYDSHLIEICFKQILLSTHVSYISMQIVMRMTHSSDVNLISSLIKKGILQVILNLYSKKGKDAGYAIGYLANICAQTEMTGFYFEHFLPSFLLDIIDFSENVHTGAPALDLVLSIQEKIPDEFIPHLFHHLECIFPTIPPFCMEKIIDITYAILFTRDINQILDILKTTKFVDCLFTLYPNAFIFEQKKLKTGSQIPIYLNRLPLIIFNFFSISQLLQFYNINGNKENIGIILSHVWRIIFNDSNDIESLQQFIELGGRQIIAMAYDEGTYNEMRTATYILSYICAILKTELLLEFVDENWIDRILDIIDPDESNHYLISLIIGVLGTLISAERITSDSTYHNKVVESNFLDIISVWSSGSSISDLVLSFINFFNENH